MSVLGLGGCKSLGCELVMGSVFMSFVTFRRGVECGVEIFR